MEVDNFFAAVGSIVGTSAAVAAAASWIAKTLIEHRLTKNVEKMKADMQAGFDLQKVMLEGEIRKQVELTIGDRAADREYVLEARKRLYLAIGPLRFQLLMACRDLAGRLIAHGNRPQYDTDIGGYYGRSLLFRILRPLALVELAERQITYADFSVDAASVELLKFKKAAFAVFSGSSLVRNRPDMNWEEQEQHVFYDCLSIAANALIVRDAAGERCMRFHEFEDLLTDPSRNADIFPFNHILQDFTPISKPLFWLRLVAYGNLCNDFINRMGAEIGFEQRVFPLSDLLKASQDTEIINAIESYVQRCSAMPASPL